MPAKKKNKKTQEKRPKKAVKKTTKTVKTAAQKKALTKKTKKLEKHPYEGRKVPSKKIYNQQGDPINLKNLAQEHPRFILYFYPKDNTPGCTQESCDFRDYWTQFKSKKTAVFGISPDSFESHNNFSQKYDLNFELLEDRNHELAEKMGVWKEKTFMGKKYMGIVRSTFLIEDSTIKKVWQPVRVKKHVENVLEELSK